MGITPPTNPLSCKINIQLNEVYKTTSDIEILISQVGITKNKELILCSSFDISILTVDILASTVDILIFTVDILILQTVISGLKVINSSFEVVT